ncbi:MAG: helix-turn-helix domain-containing protein [Planctomycetota bacterium]
MLGQPSQHNFHEILYILEGEGVQWVGSSSLPCRRGDIFFLPAGSWHIANSKHEATSIVLNFYDTCFAHALPGDREAACIVTALVRFALARGARLGVSDRTRSSVSKCLRRMAVAGGRRHIFGNQCAAKAEFLAVLAHLVSDPDLRLIDDIHPNTKFNQKRIEQGIAFIHDHFAEALPMERLADVLCVSPNHLHAIFKQQTGTTPASYVAHLRVEAAADLLQTTTVPIKQIAQQCGFPCLSHFYAVFRRHTGQTPATFRQQPGSMGGGNPQP